MLSSPSFSFYARRQVRYLSLSLPPPPAPPFGQACQMYLRPGRNVPVLLLQEGLDLSRYYYSEHAKMKAAAHAVGGSSMKYLPRCDSHHGGGGEMKRGRVSEDTFVRAFTWSTSFCLWSGVACVGGPLGRRGEHGGSPYFTHQSSVNLFVL